MTWSRTRWLGLVVAVGLLGSLALTAGAAGRSATGERTVDVQTFHVNVTSTGLDDRVDQELAPAHANLEVPDSARRMHLKVGWTGGGSDRLRVEVLPDGCLAACQQAPLAVTEGRGSVATTVEIPQSKRGGNGELHVHVTSGGDASVDRPADGTARFLAGSPAPPADDDPDPAGSTAVPSQAEASDPWLAGLVGLAVAGAGLGLLALALRALAARLLGGVGLFSRFDRDELLDHPVRRRVVDAVEAEPGVHLEALARRLDLGRGQLEHHLSQLVRADLLVEHETSGYRAYFRPAQLDPPVREALVLLKTDGARRLLEAAADDPGAGVRELARRTGLAPSTVSYHAHRLEDADLLEARDTEGSKALAATTLADQVLDLLDDGNDEASGPLAT